jgi:hypothetical protein
MKKFIIHVSIIFLAIIALMGIFDFIYTYTFSKSVARNKFQYILKMQPQKLDYIFLGSSRTANHIVPGEVTRLTGKSAINLGIEGGVLEDNLLELKLILSKKIKIQKVFLQVDYVYNDEGLSHIGNAAVLPFINNPLIKKHLETQLPNFEAVYNIPFYRYMTADYSIGFREFIFSAVGKKPRIDLYDGFSPMSGNENLNPIDLPKTIRTTNTALNEIRSLCKKNDIALVLFCAPFCSEVHYPEYIYKLKLKLPDLHDYLSAMHNNQFFNCGHLNENGAVAFTRLLISDCCK